MEEIVLLVFSAICFPIFAYLFFKAWWQYPEFERMMDRWQDFFYKPYSSIFGKWSVDFFVDYSHHPLYKWQARLIITFAFLLISFMVFALLFAPLIYAFQR